MRAAPGESWRISVAVVRTGEFGRDHARVYGEFENADLAEIFDQDLNGSKWKRLVVSPQ